MLAAPRHGFVFLAAAKAGSTAIHQAFRNVAQMDVRSPPGFKHMTAAEFEQRVAPLLEAYGFPRSGYETVALVRDPVEVLASWWRYRSRPEMDGQPMSTRDLSFDDWAEEVMAGRGRFRRPSVWASDAAGRCLIDRTWKYEHIDSAVAWMADRSGRAVTMPRLNASPPRTWELSLDVRRRLEAYLAPDFELYNSAE